MPAGTSPRLWRRFVPWPRKKTLRRWFPPFETRKSVALTIRSGATVVLDVGANAGQYGERLRACGYRGRIVSFEPLPEMHAALCRKAARDPGWETPPATAVGRAPGETVIHRYGDSSLSSALKPAEGAGGEGFAKAGEVRAPVQPLDALARAHVGEADKVFVKIDVQGMEPDVIAGAEGLLRRAVGVQIELSLIPVYDGETGYLDLLSRLDRYGLKAVWFFPVTARRRMVPEHQMDAILLRL